PPAPEAAATQPPPLDYASVTASSAESVAPPTVAWVATSQPAPATSAPAAPVPAASAPSTSAPAERSARAPAPKPRAIADAQLAALAEAQRALASARDRDSIFEIVLRAVSSTFEYAALFAVSGNEARGLSATGPGANSNELPLLKIPLDLNSPFRKAVQDGVHQLTRLRASGLEGGVAHDLGRQTGRRVLLLPVVLRGRSVMLLYGDHGQADVDAGSIGEVIALAPAIAHAFERVLMERKRNSVVPTSAASLGKMVGVPAAPKAPSIIPDVPPPFSGKGPSHLSLPSEYRSNPGEMGTPSLRAALNVRNTQPGLAPASSPRSEVASESVPVPEAPAPTVPEPLPRHVHALRSADEDRPASTKRDGAAPPAWFGVAASADSTSDEAPGESGSVSEDAAVGAEEIGATAADTTQLHSESSSADIVSEASEATDVIASEATDVIASAATAAELITADSAAADSAATEAITDGSASSGTPALPHVAAPLASVTIDEAAEPVSRPSIAKRPSPRPVSHFSRELGSDAPASSRAPRELPPSSLEPSPNAPRKLDVPSFPAEPPQTWKGFPGTPQPPAVISTAEPDAPPAAPEAPPAAVRPPVGLMTPRRMVSIDTRLAARTSETSAESPRVESPRVESPRVDLLRGEPLAPDRAAPGASTRSQDVAPAPIFEALAPRIDAPEIRSSGTMVSRRPLLDEPPEDGWGATNVPRVSRRPVPVAPRTYDDQVSRLLDGDERALDKLLDGGESAVASLIARFPGKVREPAGPQEKASDCGPLLGALVRFGLRATPFLTVRTGDENADVRRWATLLLGELPSRDAAKAIAGRLLDGSAPVRNAALASARRLQSDTLARRALRTQVEEMILDVRLGTEARSAAIQALADVREHEAIPVLLQLLGERDRTVARAAQWALSVLTRQDFGSDFVRWQSFWVEHRDEPRMEWLIAALMHEKPDIRRAAHEEIKATAGQDFGYHEELPDAERHEIQSLVRTWWARNRESS
ncbi:MAG TPA: hypothetical protein VLC09_03550, partial [Polyangiaceae bacterium]|nr:hypothetical protein [Polyangiaceae bacterium]